MAKTARQKSRVSYPKDVRSRAKAEGRGLVTVATESINGDRYEVQFPADVDVYVFLNWLAAGLAEGVVVPSEVSVAMEKIVVERLEK